jgi:tRNA(Ile)-lysidine synthase
MYDYRPIVHPSERVVNPSIYEDSISLLRDPPYQVGHQSNMDVQRQVAAIIRREQLVSPGNKVVVGVSGGPDSLCLLHVLWTCRDALGVELHIAHLNHLIRGADADADAHFVAEIAERWQIPCTIEARDVPATARKRRIAIEEAARCVRYAFLSDVARDVRAARIAVAHNADDQSETVLMHWLRGAGLAGLRGMLPAVRVGDLRLAARAEPSEGPWLIRPLLEVPRAEIERYCQTHSLAPRFDRSNLDTTLYRNKLRHELLPYLERAFKPRFREILRRSARVIRDDYDLLCEQREQAWEHTVRDASSRAIVFCRASWIELHPSLQRATLRHAVQRLRQNLRDISFQHIEAAVCVARDKEVGARATLPGGLLLRVEYNTITVSGTQFVPAPDFPALTTGHLVLTTPGVTALSGSSTAEVEIVPRNRLPSDWAHNADPWRAFLDAGAVGTQLTLRSRKHGDRFCPLGLEGKRKLINELLINEKVPARWRDLVPLLVRADGEIMWVCGWRVDHRARVTDETSQVIVIHLHMENREATV